MAVCILVLCGYKLDDILQYGCCSGLCKLVHRQEPLHRELRLDSHTCTLRVAHVVCVGLNLLHEACGCEVTLDNLAALEAVYAYVHANLVVDCAVVVEDVDSLEAILLTEHIVVNIVCGGYLQGTSTELEVYILIADNGD